jgi:hypothetical protein
MAAPLAEVRASPEVNLIGERPTMDLFFCDICNESVPQTDLDKGMAFRRGERVVCAACDEAMSNEEEGAGAAGATEPGLAGGSAQDAESSDDEGKGTEGTSPEGEAAGGEAVKRPAQVGGGGGQFAGCFMALLFIGLSLALSASAWLWVEAGKRQIALDNSIESLGQKDTASDKRFRDLQTSLSLQGQDKDAYVRESFEAMSGTIEEKFSSLGNRLGRLEDSLEALRQSSAEDRRALDAGVKDAAVAAGLAKGGVDSMGEDLGYLTDRVTALEEVLEGGMSTGTGGGGGGRQPSWFSHLPELKDASAGNRWNAVTVLGDTGDPKVVSYLLPMLADEDVFVRMATARVLGDLGSSTAIPGLIDALNDEQAAVREAVVVALRLLSGKDFRFDPLGTEADRRKGQDAWRKWWDASVKGE